MLYVYPNRAAFKTFYYRFNNEIPSFLTVVLLFGKSLIFYFIGAPYVLCNIIYLFMIHRNLKKVWNILSPNLKINLHFRKGVIHRNMKGKVVVEYSLFKKSDGILPINIESGMILSITPNGNHKSHLAGLDSDTGIGFQCSRYPHKFFSESTIDFRKSSIVVQSFDSPLELECDTTNVELINYKYSMNRFAFLSNARAISLNEIIKNKVNCGVYKQYKIYERISNHSKVKELYNINTENIVQEKINCQISIDLSTMIYDDSNIINGLFLTNIDKSMNDWLKEKNEYYHTVYESIDDNLLRDPIKNIIYKINHII